MAISDIKVIPLTLLTPLGKQSILVTLDGSILFQPEDLFTTYDILASLWWNKLPCIISFQCRYLLVHRVDPIWV